MDDVFLGVMVIIHISMMLGIFHMNVHTSAVAMWWRQFTDKLDGSYLRNNHLSVHASPCELHIKHIAERKNTYSDIIANHRTTAIERPKRPFQNYALKGNYTVKSSLSESVNALMKEGLQFLKTGFYDNAPHMRSYHTLHCNFIFAIYSTRLNRYTKYQGIEHSTRPILLNI